MTKKTAIAYYRTSSQSDIGEGTDTLPRQKEACKRYALMNNIEIAAEFYDGGVRGTIKVEDRPEFGKALNFMSKQNIGLVLVETANRFSRDVLVQLMGHDLLKSLGIDLVPVDAPAHFTDDTPTSEMLRTIIAAVSQYEKKSLVKKMSDAKARKREKGERTDGRIPPPAAAVALALELRKTGMAYRKIGEELSKAGFRVIQKNKTTKQAEVTNRPYQAQSVKNMIENMENDNG